MNSKYNILKTLIDAGGYAIAWVNSCHHYILIYDYNTPGTQASDFLVSDPGKTYTGTKSLADYTLCSGNTYNIVPYNASTSAPQATFGVLISQTNTDADLTNMIKNTLVKITLGTNSQKSGEVYCNQLWVVTDPSGTITTYSTDDFEYTFVNTGTYTISLAVQNENGFDAEVKTVTVIDDTNSDQCTAIPDAPSASSQSGATSAGFSVTWPAVDCATSYNVYIYTNTGIAFSANPFITSSNSYTYASGLAASTTYEVKVSAINEYGESAKSPNLNVITSAAPKPANCPVTSFTAETCPGAWAELTGDNCDATVCGGCEVCLCTYSINAGFSVDGNSTGYPIYLCKNSEVLIRPTNQLCDHNYFNILDGSYGGSNNNYFLSIRECSDYLTFVGSEKSEYFFGWQHIIYGIYQLTKVSQEKLI